jgi:hypothetical protein
MPLSHVRDEDLELYLLGRLPSDRLFDVESHLMICNSCTSRLSTAAGFTFRLLKLVDRHIANYGGNEKRREHRIPTDHPGKMQSFSPFSLEKIPIQIRDISRNGLKVQTPQFAERGTIVQIVFKNAIILGEVRYCVAAGTEFDTGIQIQDVIPRQQE